LIQSKIYATAKLNFLEYTDINKNLIR